MIILISRDADVVEPEHEAPTPTKHVAPAHSIEILINENGSEGKNKKQPLEMSKLVPW